MSTDFPLQTLVVAGGWSGSRYLSSTELLSPGDSSWTTAASLPYAAWGLRSASLAGSLYISGGYNEGEFKGERGEQRNPVRSHHPAELLRWDDQTESWAVAGMMETARSYHAMVAVTTDADRFCTPINT